MCVYMRVCTLIPNINRSGLENTHAHMLDKSKLEEKKLVGDIFFANSRMNRFEDEPTTTPLIF